MLLMPGVSPVFIGVISPWSGEMKAVMSSVLQWQKLHTAGNHIIACEYFSSITLVTCLQWRPSYHIIENGQDFVTDVTYLKLRLHYHMIENGQDFITIVTYLKLKLSHHMIENGQKLYFYRCNHLTLFGSHFELIPNDLSFTDVENFFK